MEPLGIFGQQLDTAVTGGHLADMIATIDLRTSRIDRVGCTVDQDIAVPLAIGETVGEEPVAKILRGAE